MSLSFNPSCTALLVIDMQRDFLDPGGYAAVAGLDISRLRATIEPVQRLLAMARRHELPIIFTREGHRANLSDCPPAKLARSRAAGQPGPVRTQPDICVGAGSAAGGSREIGRAHV